MSFEEWLQHLESRHFADLRFSEVTRALRALSSAYVQRRHRLAEGAALDGAGKRAAFALFYGPLHFLVVQAIVRALGAARVNPSVLVDLGCGTGAAGAAWATSFGRLPRVLAIDRNPWALAEAADTYRAFGVSATVRQGDVARFAWPPGRAAVLAAFAVNELGDGARDTLLRALLERAQRGDSVLVVEPLARSATPWWDGWREAFAAVRGRGDEWRFRSALPAVVAKLDRAAGLNRRDELTARSIYVGPPGGAPA